MQALSIQPNFKQESKINQPVSKPSVQSRTARRAHISNLSLAQPLDALVKFAMARAEFFAPHEFKLETGRLVSTLARQSDGLNKTELLAAFYPCYKDASFRRKESLETCMNKLLQRARPRFQPLGIDIAFCKYTSRWKLVPASLG